MHVHKSHFISTFGFPIRVIAEIINLHFYEYGRYMDLFSFPIKEMAEIPAIMVTDVLSYLAVCPDACDWCSAGSPSSCDVCKTGYGAYLDGTCARK